MFGWDGRKKWPGHLIPPLTCQQTSRTPFTLRQARPFGRMIRVFALSDTKEEVARRFYSQKII